MISFKDIIGQGHIINHFVNAMKYNKVSHAYIINGEDGTGKKTLAKAFAATMQCESDGDKPCGKCQSCKQCMTDNQPDIKWITHEKPNTISVDDVRKQLNSDILIKPYSSRFKIYIIDEAEKLNTAAQNAILKTIEEPPEYAVILLLTNNAASFLPTIMSRCVMLNMRPVPEEAIIQYLIKKEQLPDYTARVSAKFSGGNLGRAIQLGTSEHFNALKENVLQIVKHVNDMELSELVGAVKVIEEYKLETDDYINTMIMWYRDVLLYKTTMDLNGIIFKEEMNEIRRQAAKCTFNGLQEILQALDKAKVRLKANVNFDLVMELMFLTINERMKS